MDFFHIQIVNPTTKEVVANSIAIPEDRAMELSQILADIFPDTEALSMVEETNIERIIRLVHDNYIQNDRELGLTKQELINIANLMDDNNRLRVYGWNWEVLIDNEVIDSVS